VNQLTRRDCLKAGVAGFGAAALAPAVTATHPRTAAETYSVHQDHVLGTSLDLCVAVPGPAHAAAAERAALVEIERLRLVLSVYDPASELSRVNRSDVPVPVSPEMAEVLRAYEYWHKKTGGAFCGQLGRLARTWRDAEITGELPSAAALARTVYDLRSPGWHLDGAASTVRRTTDQALDLNALGKVYIIGKATAAVRTAVPSVTGLLVNLGGDVFAWGVPSGGTGWAVGVQDPFNHHDNAPPLGGIRLKNQAVASSGGYRRFYTVAGTRYSHILDPRTGYPAGAVAGCTVVADDNLSANALATALCVLSPEAGLRLVRSTSGAECLIVAADGTRFQTPGLELLPVTRAGRPVAADPKDRKDGKKDSPWPDGYQVTVAVELPKIEATRYRRPYTAVWIEDDARKAVRTLAVWGDAPKYLRDLSDWWKIAKGDADLVKAVTRATRGPGKYNLVWDGNDDKGNALPQGTYTVRVEVHREHGKHLRQSGKIDCKEDDAAVKLDKNEETGETAVEYGKKKSS
jgi:thiamine biosynthesis lipoprotein ApbE